MFMFRTSTRSHYTESTSEMVDATLRRPSTNVPPYSTVVSQGPFITPPIQDAFEEIWSNDDGSHKEWKSVQHYKRWTSPVSGVGSFTRLSDNQIESGNYRISEHRDPYWGYYYREGYGATAAPFAGLQQLYDKVADGDFVPPPAQLSVLKQRSLDHMLPRIKAELSLLNSLIELKDFKTLPHTLASIGGFLVKTGKTLRSLFRTASDGYLQAQFNVLPLLSDISGIRAALSRTEKRINDLVSRQGRVQSRHFTLFLDELEPDAYKTTGDTYVMCPVRVPGYHDITSTVARRLVINHPTIFHTQVQYNYNYTEYQVAHAQLLGLLDALGVNLNPAIIWNAIPWSFVIDWVVGVSRWLNQFKGSALEPMINIHRYLWSVKRRRDTYITLENSAVPVSQYPSYPILRNPLPGVHETAYSRSVSIPEMSSIQLSGLTVKEVSLGAALALSRRHKPSRSKRWR